MFALFTAGIVSAILVTLCLSSVIKRGWAPSPPEGDNPEEGGLDALKKMTYFGAMAQRLRQRRRK